MKKHIFSHIAFTVVALLFCLIPGLAKPARSQHTPTWETGNRDILGAALDTVGFTREDLGYRPEGYWSRFPRPPYKLPIFDSLFAEPMRVYDYTRCLGNSVSRFLDPDLAADIRYDGAPYPNRIHILMLSLCIEPRVDGFRAYSVNLLPQADPETPILDAIGRIFIADSDRLARLSFGDVPAWPNPEADIIAQLEGVDAEFQKIFAELMLNALDASQWRDQAVREIPMDLMTNLFYITDFAQTQGDGIIYYPQVDDVARLFDDQSMAYAAMKAGQATEDCRYTLEAWLAEHPDDKNFEFETITPFGRIVIADSENDVHSYDDYFILVDLGGDDIYTGPVGATSRPDIGIGICLDLEGDDRYECDSVSSPSQGAGVLGCGVLYDAYGDDEYKAIDMAQGAGFFGTGILYDGDGTDGYRMEETGQGAGNFGHGLALDSGDGDDYYYMYGEGQGFGGCNGVGICANWSGDEHYVAEPDASVYYRGDYHSDFLLNVSNCQGVGSGRRGDGTDGHSYAGGLGLIADVHGNDKYEAGNFSIGCGYWFGIGLVFEKEGNDTYYSPVYTQASGAHYCIGALIDEAGDDVHDTWDHSTSAISFARDWTISLLVDKSGDDYYRAYNTSLCYVNIRSNAFFFDLAGNDHYVIGTPQRMLGSADFQNYNLPWSIASMTSYSNSIGVFIDAAGDDIYEDWTKVTVGEGDQTCETGRVEPSVYYGNNMRWQSPSPDEEIYGYNNYGIGWDLEAGENATIPDIIWLDPKPVEEEVTEN